MPCTPFRHTLPDGTVITGIACTRGSRRPSGVAQPPSAVNAVADTELRAEEATPIDADVTTSPPGRIHPLSEDCWKVIDFLRWRAWRATALALNEHGLWSHRQRISDLRKKHLVDITAESHTDPATGKLHTTYFVPPAYIPRAEYLWQHRTSEGFAPAPVQPKLF